MPAFCANQKHPLTHRRLALLRLNRDVSVGSNCPHDLDLFGGGFGYVVLSEAGDPHNMSRGACCHLASIVSLWAAFIVLMLGLMGVWGWFLGFAEFWVRFLYV